jgi:hypothetical protein
MADFMVVGYVLGFATLTLAMNRKRQVKMIGFVAFIIAWFDIIYCVDLGGTSCT